MKWWRKKYISRNNKNVINKIKEPAGIIILERNLTDASKPAKRTFQEFL